jgi:hypothetical protein
MTCRTSSSRRRRASLAARTTSGLRQVYLSFSSAVSFVAAHVRSINWNVARIGFLFPGMFAAANPLSGRKPYLIIKQPQRGPWQDRVGQTHRGIPLILTWSVQTEGLLSVHVRDGVVAMTLQRRVNYPSSRMTSELVLDANTVQPAERAGAQRSFPHEAVMS